MNKDLFNILKKIAENQGSPYKSIKLIEDRLIIVLNDGEIITKHDATEEDYYAVLEAKTKIEIKNKISIGDFDKNFDVIYTDSVDPLGFGKPYLSNMKKTIKSRINKIN